LQKEVVNMQQQLQVVNEVVVDHEAKIGGLEDARLAECKVEEISIGCDCEARRYEDTHIACYSQGLSI
jgi:hypothetical protein